MDVSALTTRLADLGLNVQGVASAADWDAAMAPARQSAALLPSARSILVFGNGGSRLWDTFLADLRRDPRGLTGEANPLDAYVRRAVLDADALLGDTPRRWFWAATEVDMHIDFRLLAGLAGLGTQSRLGLLIDPAWGMWIGLRAACFLAADLPASAPAAADPCAGCPAPCITACPASAFVDGRWDVDRCVRFHADDDRCERTCASRLACPVGADRRYRPEHYAYHAHRESGRRWIRAHLGLPEGADPYEGIGPFWGDWRKRVDVKGTSA